MIKYFSGTNYKAFKDFKIELKPLTILLGANSCGKSAILNSFLMLSQSIDSSTQSGTPLRMNGDRIGMGEVLNIIKDKNPDNEMSFSFEVDDTVQTQNLINSMKRDCIDAHFTLAKYIFQTLRQNKHTHASISQLIESLDDIYYRSESYNSNQLRTISQKLIHIIREYRNFSHIFEDARRIAMPYSVINFLKEVSFKKITECLENVVPISSVKIAAKRVTIKFKYHPKNKEIFISALLVENENNEIIFSLDVDSRGDISLLSDVIDNDILRRSRQDFKRTLNLKSILIFDSSMTWQNNYHEYFNELNNPLVIYLSKVLAASLREFRTSFSGRNVNHVSPLRAFPQRYYLLDKAIYHQQLNAMEGTELAEILKNRPDIKKSINELLIKFNLSVEVEKVNDIIHKISVNQEAVKLELTDVGFGISQVLPILVQAYLSPAHSITIIEQPEIHLHPKMQAWLTDALISIAMKNEKIFIIETHSDALVRRLRLRIVDDKNEFSESDVSIYYLERNRKENRTEVNEIKVSSDGDISWPSEFMDVEINDTLMIQKKKIEKMLKKNEDGDHA
ncbi:AAA family ATPase [Pantoea dispersa]|uniref:AAA family ATPase n=1 Tax=Pantoea dispersa TaxID=59814 RepID=UPI000FDC169C|nr:AAA family ATPase [Pantoea dispersa]MCT6592948.1 AAA family ATPase [Pantoea dispersa]RVU72111.1 hypothetical protein EKH82_23175 [Pantoea dispersa]